MHQILIEFLKVLACELGRWAAKNIEKRIESKKHRKR